MSDPTVAVITIVHGRHDHLRRQHASLLRQDRRPDHWVVVAMGDPGVISWSPTEVVPVLVDIAVPALGLPLAAARNTGADVARGLKADVLVFLDVDCLASPSLVAAYTHLASETPGHLWCGPVTYLPPAPSSGYDLGSLPDNPHPGRPAPRHGTIEAAAPEHWDLFWSLSFAITPEDLDRVGGFCEEYVGYGGEDTDFAQSARAAGLGLTWVGSARAHHQHHPVSSPPIEHASDIVRNAGIFHRRWGWWPMGGWLAELAELGAITHDDDGTWRVAS